jgi:hypothetical protein
VLAGAIVSSSSITMTCPIRCGAQQIDQFLTFMKRVEDVLGQGWELCAEGQKLQSELTAFRKKLDT